MSLRRDPLVNMHAVRSMLLRYTTPQRTSNHSTYGTYALRPLTDGANPLQNLMKFTSNDFKELSESTSCCGSHRILQY